MFFLQVWTINRQVFKKNIVFFDKDFLVQYYRILKFLVWILGYIVQNFSIGHQTKYRNIRMFLLKRCNLLVASAIRTSHAEWREQLASSCHFHVFDWGTYLRAGHASLLISRKVFPDSCTYTWNLVKFSILRHLNLTVSWCSTSFTTCLISLGPVLAQK